MLSVDSVFQEMGTTPPGSPMIAAERYGGCHGTTCAHEVRMKPTHDKPAEREKSENETPAFTQSVRLGRLLGIDIHLDLSLIIIFFLIATTLGMGTFPAWHPD